jgi:hypothetical protein
LLESVSAGFAEHTASSHVFGAVDAPGTAHAPPGHSEVTAHGAPAFEPTTQRFPPHTVAPTAVQSALLLHAVAARLLHVWQKHLFPVNPAAVQFG